MHQLGLGYTYICADVERRFFIEFRRLVMKLIAEWNGKSSVQNLNIGQIWKYKHIQQESVTRIKGNAQEPPPPPAGPKKRGNCPYDIL